MRLTKKALTVVVSRVSLLTLAEMLLAETAGLKVV
jgi:hypothetical protein